jgi:hypothetical protein
VAQQELEYLELFYLHHQKYADAEAKTENRVNRHNSKHMSYSHSLHNGKILTHATYSWSQLKLTSYRLPPSHPNPLYLKKVIVFV